MKTTFINSAQLAVAGLLLCSVCSAAQESVHGAPPAAPEMTVTIFALAAQQRADESADRAVTERRQAMIKDCEENNGIDCAREVDTELRAEQLQSMGALRLRAPR